MKTNKLLVLLLIVYLATRLIALTKLPVFADEAIYIRWAQMIFDDPKQFTFLPLYDGKTPLFIWLLVPLVNNPIIDPLLAARFLSILAVMGLLWSLWLIIKELGGTTRARLISSLLVIFLPFTFFYSRMALIDGLLSMWLGFSFWSYVKARNQNYDFKWLWMAGLFWGLGLMTKTSAFYYAPVMAGIAIYDWWTNHKLRNRRTFLSLSLTFIIGLSFIGWMRISPLFPFLFQRSSDFAFSVGEIIANPIHIVYTNIWRIGRWLIIYLTPIVWLTVLTGHWLKLKKQAKVLIASSVLFGLPFVITGKLLSSRYFLPMVIWLIPLASIELDGWYQKNKRVFAGLATGLLVFCALFIWLLYTNPGNTPFPNEDVVQYLTEWSAGFGIPEVRDYIANRAKDHKVYVATEGYFGTLPDGLYIYFNRSPLQKNLEIHGIGQPITSIPQELFERAAFEEVYLVVNEHRFLVKPLDPRMELVETYARPQGPPLLLFRIKS